MIYNAITGHKKSNSENATEDEETTARYAIICDGIRIELFAHDAQQAEKRATKIFERAHGRKPSEMTLHYLGARK